MPQHLVFLFFCHMYMDIRGSRNMGRSMFKMILVVFANKNKRERMLPTCLIDKHLSSPSYSVRGQEEEDIYTVKCIM